MACDFIFEVRKHVNLVKVIDCPKMCVSYCRYHLLVQRNDDIDMNSPKRRSLKAVWLIFFMVFLSQIAAQAYLFMRGWPKVKMSEIGAETFLIMFTLAACIANIPDIISIFIYTKMWRHFRTTVQPDHGDILEMAMDNDNYGGIWVGGSADELTNNYSQEEEPPPVLDMNHIHSSNEENSHYAKSVLKTLHWHLRFSLVDIFLPIVGVLGCSELIIRSIYLFQVVFYFWIPLMIIKKSFEQLNGTKDYLLQAFKCH